MRIASLFVSLDVFVVGLGFMLGRQWDIDMSDTVHHTTFFDDMYEACVILCHFVLEMKVAFPN